MVSKGEIKAAEFEDQALRDSHFAAGTDEGSALEIAQVGEVATCEIGEDDSVADFVAWLAGSKSEDSVKTGAGRAFFNGWTPSTDSNGDKDTKLPLDTLVRLAVRGRNERGGKGMTEWTTLGELWDDGMKGEVSFDAGPPIAKARRVVTVQIKHPSQQVTYSHAHSNYKFPGRKGE